MQKQNAETKLYNAVALAAIGGNVVEPGSFGRAVSTYDEPGTKPTVCLCGSVLVAAGISVDEIENWTGENIIKTVARKLGITLQQAASLNNGFEGDSRATKDVAGAWYEDEPKNPLKNGVDKTWYNIGKKLRKVYAEA